MSLARKKGDDKGAMPEDELKAYKSDIGKQYMDGLLSDKEYEDLLEAKKAELGLNAAPSAPAKAHGPECPTCGALVKPQDVECNICGTALTPVMAEAAPKKTPQPDMDVPKNWREEWLIKPCRQMTPEELLKQPPDALKGISKDDSKRMMDAFNIRTLENFAINKFMLWAQELVELKDAPESFRNEDFKHKLIKEYETKGLDEILASPTFAFQGVSENDARKLDKAFNTKTVEELGSLKYPRWASCIYEMAPPRVYKVGDRVLMPSGRIGRVASVTEPDENGLQKVEVAVG